MEIELQAKLEELGAKIDATYIVAEKTRKYFLWTLIAAGIGCVLPLIGLTFAIPFYLKTLSSVAF